MEIGSIKTGQNQFASEPKVQQEARVARKVLVSNEKIEQEGYEKPTVDEIKSLVDEMNQLAKVSNTRVSFGYSDDIGAMYVKVIDSETGQLIRQFPSDEAIRFASKMREWVGMLLDKTI